MEFLIGIDIGGTQVKAGSFDLEGNVLCSHTTELKGGEHGPARVRECIRILERECGKPAVGLGIAAPGLAAPDESSIACLPGGKVKIEGLKWADALDFSGPVRVLNDAHAALLGEVWQGAARGLREVVLVTLGTGVGGAILTGGKLLRGHLGRAGHIGHISLDPRGKPGICGVPGSLEDFIGNQSIMERSGGRYPNTRELVEGVRAGDAEAEKIWMTSLDFLACGLASIINVVDPEAILIGGGIGAGAGDTLMIPLRKAMDRVEWRPTGERVKLLQTELGEWSGACGAACRVLITDLK